MNRKVEKLRSDLDLILEKIDIIDRSIQEEIDKEDNQ